MVTLTRGIDMYLIGPFPRPQFFGGSRPQILAVPRPQFSIEGCYLPLEPTLGGQQSAARSQRFKRHATTPRSRSERPERDHQYRDPHDVEQPGSEKPNTLTGVPPRNDPTGLRPGTTDRLDGREEHEPTRRVP